MWPLEYTTIRGGTTVTTRSIVDERGSTSAETLMEKSPTAIQRYSGTTTVCVFPPSTSRKTPIETSAERPTATEAMTPVRRPSHRRPKRPFTRKAASGNAGMSHTSEITPLSPHLMDLVHVHHRPVAIGRQDDSQPDGDFSRRDHENEDDEDASALVDRAVLAREGDEREVRRVEHELDAHGDHHRVAADAHPCAAEEEEGRRDDDVRAKRDGHRRRRSAASSGSSRLVSTIAPTIAARRSTDAISNGNAKSVNTLVASATRSPPPGRDVALVKESPMIATGIATAATNTAASGVCRWKNSARGRSPNFVNMTP